MVQEVDFQSSGAEQARNCVRDHWPRHRGKILQGKRFLILKEMLHEMKYPDMGIVQEIMDGFNLIGNCGGGAP